MGGPVVPTSPPYIQTVEAPVQGEIAQIAQFVDDASKSVQEMEAQVPRFRELQAEAKYAQVEVQNKKRHISLLAGHLTFRFPQQYQGKLAELLAGLQSLMDRLSALEDVFENRAAMAPRDGSPCVSVAVSCFEGASRVLAEQKEENRKLAQECAECKMQCKKMQEELQKKDMELEKLKMKLDTLQLSRREQGGSSSRVWSVCWPPDDDANHEGGAESGIPREENLAESLQHESGVGTHERDDEVDVEVILCEFGVLHLVRGRNGELRIGWLRSPV